MRKYYLFFKVRFSTGIQYRSASVTALTTQLLWGLMECIAFRAIAEASGNTLPMNQTQIVSYIWLKEALLALFHAWAMDGDIFDMVIQGGISYELCRPVSVYQMWFARSIGDRVSEAILKSIPIILVAFLLPKPYKMSLPVSPIAFVLFVVTMILGMMITVSFCMLVYMLCLFTISPQGIRMVLTGAVEFLSGAVIPLPFFPQPYRRLVEMTPFAFMENVPFRIYCGDFAGENLAVIIGKQVLWIVILVFLGNTIWKRAQKNIVVQGG